MADRPGLEDWPTGLRTLWLHVSTFDKLAAPIVEASRPSVRQASYYHHRVCPAANLIQTIYGSHREHIEKTVGRQLEDDMHIALELLSRLAVPIVKNKAARNRAGGSLIDGLCSNASGVAAEWPLLIGRLRQHAETLRRSINGTLPAKSATSRLTETEKTVDEFIRQEGEASLKTIRSATGVKIETLTRHIIPALKEKRGLLSRPYRYE